MELTISRWDGNGREIKRSGNKSGNRSGNKSGNKLGTSRETRRETRLHVGRHRNRFVTFITTAVFYVPCMYDSGIQGHTNGSTRTCTSSKNSIMATNVTACVQIYCYVWYETPYYVFLKNNFQWFVRERANKITRDHS
ncbi:unnamed protein product [Ascophyllum nodosum]